MKVQTHTHIHKVSRKKLIIVLSCCATAIVALTVCLLLVFLPKQKTLSLAALYFPKEDTLQALALSPYLMLDADEISAYMRNEQLGETAPKALLTTANDALTAFEFESTEQATAFYNRIQSDTRFYECFPQRNLVFASCARRLSTLLTAQIFLFEGDYYLTLNDSACALIGADSERSAFVLPDQAGGYTVTEVGYRAFAGGGVQTVALPSALTYLGRQAFFACGDLRAVDLTKCAALTEIDDSAFGFCSALTEIMLPPALKTVGAFAFEECGGLTAVEFSSPVERLGTGVFYSAGALAEIKFTVPSSYTFAEGALYDAAKTQLLFYSPAKRNTAFALPSSVTALGYGAFAENVYLKKIEQQGGALRTLGESCFLSCIKLESVPVGQCTSIAKRAFFNCKALSAVEFSDGLTALEDEAFRYCTALTAVTLPLRLAGIGANAFHDCSRLTSVTLLAAEPPAVKANSFSKPVTLYVPDLARYRAAADWGAYYNELAAKEATV